MKKLSIILFISFFAFITKGFAQTTSTPTDFFAGKWEIYLNGTPYGDMVFATDLVRKDGKLTGTLTNDKDPNNPNRQITKVEEKDDKMSIFFESSQGGELSFDLMKVDDDNLKGTLMTFEANAKRIK